MTTTVAAIVLNYRNWEGATEVVEALRLQTKQPDVVLVVDNASVESPNSRVTEKLRSLGARIMPLKENLGYAGAMNLGADDPEVRRCEFLLLLTHDCLLGPDSLVSLTAALEEDESVAIVGPLLGWRSSPARVFSAGGVLGPGGRTEHVCLPPFMTDWKDAEARTVDWLDGAAMLVRRDSWEDLGGFADDYFLYFEEVDFQVRARRAGGSVVLVPRACAWQQPGNLSPYLYLRNRLLFVSRLGTQKDRLAFVPALPGYVRHVVGVGGFAGLYWGFRGLIDGVMGRSGPPPAGSMGVGSAPSGPMDLNW